MLRTTEDVATAVRQARKERGLTQAQLAQRAGVGRDWLVRLVERRGLVPVLRTVIRADRPSAPLMGARA